MEAFEKELSTRVSEIEGIIQKYLPAEEGYQKTVLEAMNYQKKECFKKRFLRL